MLRTDKELIELRLTHDWENVKNTVVDRLMETFGHHPNHFFTEHDIHSVLVFTSHTAEETLELKRQIAKLSQQHEITLATALPEEN